MPRDTADLDDGTVPGESETEQRKGGMTRRRLVATGAATWATVSLAGCNYITDPGVETPAVSTETTTTGNTSTSNETSTDDSSDGGSDDSGDTGGGEETETSCASVGRFSRGMEVGLHVAIYDPATGDPLGADAVDGVTVTFPNADYGPVELNWEGPHEAYDRDTWGSKIETDADTEPGTYEYEVHVESENEGDTATITDEFTVV
ncbi:hypothetical protein [Haloarcula onubensis]|uniref:Uncharacterized protein n=1 Tax=Haloarcula onubensis TaxID=2950539 RepID=A0ABU2FMW9_9EURY|nr:hypothetical protein [Halomicroarcula sp. S3CR25-11]MDS0281642.1 hypothetical protein [Halomicroarcula sp. S3CR25-11]